MALNDQSLEQLRFKGEGADLDYKAERPKFKGATDAEKAELLKDILAMANSHREGPAYILYGFKEDAPNPPEVVGLPLDGAIDDSRIQQFVNEKLDTKLNFRYEERMFQEKHIAVVTIPKQPRPFTLKKPYGGLDKDVVYIRRGSSTSTALAREIAMMGAADAARPPANAAVEFRHEDNKPLGNEFDLTFYEKADEYPDYETYVPNERWPIGSFLSPGMSRDNRDFWREAADFVVQFKRLIRIRIKVSNGSAFALTSAKVEVRVVGTDESDAELLPYGDMPDVPRKTDSILHNVMRSPAMDKPTVVVDRRGDYPVCVIQLGTLLPGETAVADDDLAVLPSGAGSYAIRVRLLAQETNPLAFEHRFEAHGEHAPLDFVRLEEIVSGSPEQEVREEDEHD
ncbi:AlbA family DNA-binding domain-containing protein [Luteimonas granuli]|nr:ATP-binding protein [Luteimonas granuli]